MDDLMNSPPKLTRTLTLDGTKVIFNPLAVRPAVSASPISSLHQQGPSSIKSGTPQNGSLSDHQLMTLLPDASQRTAPQDDDGSSLAYEGSLVDQCIENVLSLPEEVGQVAQKNRDMTIEINLQRECLSKAKGKLLKANEERDQVQQEINAVGRKICVTEDEVAIKYKLTTQLQKDADEMVSENSKLMARVVTNKKILDKEKLLHDTYRKKMEKHVQMVDDLESTFPINRELLSQLKKVQALREEKGDLESNPEEKEKILNGTYERKLQSEINGLKAKRIRMTKDTNHRQEQLNAVKERQAQIKQDIEILHKRNQAKLIRLKRQLKEAQVRNRQWNEEACQLEQSIAELRQQVEE
ncbi:coiled-coil domain-containing protein 122-like [Ptychodera flava]|uniref:coiled-coil domain-containing protein 122-like n=1 Tax=Ptychodera flava TaxID=63121 RepID=UPI003969DCD3